MSRRAFIGSVRLTLLFRRSKARSCRIGQAQKFGRHLFDQPTVTRKCPLLFIHSGSLNDRFWPICAGSAARDWTVGAAPPDFPQLTGADGRDRPVWGDLMTDLGRKVHTRLERLELGLIANGVQCPFRLYQLQAR